MFKRDRSPDHFHAAGICSLLVCPFELTQQDRVATTVTIERGEIEELKRQYSGEVTRGGESVAEIIDRWLSASLEG